MSGVKSFRFTPLSVAALALAVLMSGCDALDRFLQVEAPSRVVASDLDDASRAELLVQSVGNEFRCAFTHYANASGMVGWEWRTVQNGGTRAFYDQRQWTTGGYAAGAYAGADCGGGNTALYIPLSRTRWFADEMLRRLDDWGVEEVPEKTAFEAEVAAWAGYTYLFFGESMCSVTFDSGPEQPPEDAFDLAIQRFDRAMDAAQASGRDDFVNLARVGKGRTLLNLGRASEAAQAVEAVPAGFTFELQYSALTQATQNRQYRENRHVEAVGVGEMYQNMEFDGVPDPRVPVRDEERTVAGYDVPLWSQLKYNSFDDPVRLAGWEEAQLIIAEAAVGEGRLQDAVDIINALHANVDLPEFQSSDPDEIMEAIIYNRRAELFLESHHLMDLKRYNLPLHPAPGEPFHAGGLYGNQTCFPLPDVERFNNPNIPS